MPSIPGSSTALAPGGMKEVDISDLEEDEDEGHGGDEAARRQTTFTDIMVRAGFEKGPPTVPPVPTVPPLNLNKWGGKARS